MHPVCVRHRLVSFYGFVYFVSRFFAPFVNFLHVRIMRLHETFVYQHETPVCLFFCLSSALPKITQMYDVFCRLNGMWLPDAEISSNYMLEMCDMMSLVLPKF